MSNKILFDAGIIIAVCVAGVTYLASKGKPQDAPSAALAVTESIIPQPKARSVEPKRSASVVTIPKNPRDGQFWTYAKVDRGSIHFLVDTGASSVALTPNDARKAGIRLNDLTYNVPISTAGGRNWAASVTLDRVSIGGITVRDVHALVVKEGLNTSLLGMSFLGDLQKVEASPTMLTLKL